MRRIFLRNKRCDKMTRRFVFVFQFAMIIIIATTSCGTHTKMPIAYPYNVSIVPNYDDPQNWAALPFLKDNADSISAAFEGDVNEDMCDVFFLYPTSFTEERFRSVSNSAIDDTVINSKTDNSSILYQASVFNGVGRIYAPRYRQAHIYRYYDKGPNQLPAFELAYQDVKRSFLKYLRDWNNGRPIVIAAHSQGTTHAVRLVKEMMDGHELGNKIIYMYLIGMPVKKREFKEIRPCESDSSNNCFYSWRTFRKGYTNDYTNINETSIHVTNPVDINNSSGWTGPSLKREAILWKFNVAYKNAHSTRVMGDMLWISRPRFKGGIVGVFIKNYHAGDINLFYGDIRNDIRKRLKIVLQGN
ncbi:MAG: DUF3089 domain-containing protein [bacterium]